MRIVKVLYVLRASFDSRILVSRLADFGESIARFTTLSTTKLAPQPLTLQ